MNFATREDDQGQFHGRRPLRITAVRSYFNYIVHTDILYTMQMRQAEIFAVANKRHVTTKHIVWLLQHNIRSTQHVSEVWFLHTNNTQLCSP